MNAYPMLRHLQKQLAEDLARVENQPVTDFKHFYYVKFTLGESEYTAVVGLKDPITTADDLKILEREITLTCINQFCDVEVININYLGYHDAKSK